MGGYGRLGAWLAWPLAPLASPSYARGHAAPARSAGVGGQGGWPGVSGSGRGQGAWGRWLLPRAKGPAYSEHPAAVPAVPAVPAVLVLASSARLVLSDFALWVSTVPGQEHALGGSDRRYRCPLGVASGRNNRQRWALLLLSAVCVRRAGLPRRGENRFLRPTQKNPWYSRMPRARVFSFCPAYPRRQGGAGYPCPRLAAGRILAPRSALSPWPLAGRFRAVRGARRGLGRLAPAWLVRGGVRWLLFLRWCCGCVRRRCGGWRWRGPRGGGRRAVGRARFAVLRGAVRWCRRVARCSPRRPARAGRMTGRGGECGRAVLRGRPAFLAALRGGRAGAQATTGHLAGAEPVPSLAVAPLPAALRRHGSASGTRQAVGPGERPTRRAPALLPVAGFEWAVKRGRSWRWGRRPGADRHPRPIPGVGARTRIGAGYASAKDG